ncbi:MAG: DUF3306 domain-containing protein [Burkholderiales bacterium]
MKSRPEEAPPPEDREPFLDRWSRRKQEVQSDVPPQQPVEKAADPAANLKTPPELPPVEKLTFDSDYRAFFHPKVSEDTRRAALKKLFSDPRFNVMDGLDTYIDDYSKTEPIPPAMLAGLKQVQNILEWAKGNDPERKEAGREERAVPGSPAALEEHGAPPVPALAEQPADDTIASASEPPQGGRNS